MNDGSPAAVDAAAAAAASADADATGATVVTGSTGASSSSTASPPLVSNTLAQAAQTVNITALIPYKLDMAANNFGKWSHMFLLLLSRLNLSHHVDGTAHDDDDADWIKEDITVLMWIYNTISEELYDMIRAPKMTAWGVWNRLEEIFCDNKVSRAVHLEAEFHGLVQGDMTASAYCHRLKTLADALADCDYPVLEKQLVLQLIRGLNPKFAVLKTMLPMLPEFPTFYQARSYLQVEETAQRTTAQQASESALMASGG